MRVNGPGRAGTRSGDRMPYGDTIKRDITLRVTVGMKFSKPTITQTLGGDEPMVCLDAAALTQRIGSISHPEKPAPSPIYHTMTSHQQPYEAKWRRALRPRAS
jgi:hypothetical protein